MVAADIVCCASCGVAAIDDIKLMICDGGCDLVKYCSDGCQSNNREQHEEECNKRLAELHDKKIFTQPDISHRGECPLCYLPLSLDPKKSVMMGCCCKTICNGCCYANQKRENQQGLEERCAFCREPAPNSDEEHFKNVMERVKKNDPVAMTAMGKTHYGEGDFGRALEYYAKAAELGDLEARCLLGSMCFYGRGVEKKDEKKAVYHWEQAAIGGHPDARGHLAAHEIDYDRPDRAVKHFMINANLGCDTSLQCIKDLFVGGIVSKEEYAAALRGYQSALDATKSAERDEAEAFYKAREDKAKKVQNIIFI